jgi:hypothetical protein
MALVVGRQPLTMEDQVRTQVSPCGICGGESGTGIGFSLIFLVFPVNFIKP